MNKRLYRSAHDRMLAGVCGGIAEYFQIDPTLVRLGWVAFTALGGSGILAYIILAVIVQVNTKKKVLANLLFWLDSYYFLCNLFCFVKDITHQTSVFLIRLL